MHRGNRRVPQIAAAVVLGISAGLALALAGFGGTNSPGGNSLLGGDFTVEQARAFQDFPVYNAGESVEGSPLVAVLRRNDTANFISFIYGDCVATSESGCAPPVEIQTWPACLRNLALYDPSVPGTPVPERTAVRGVPAAFLDDGTRLEIHTGRSLIVIFSGSEASVLRIANALRGVNAPVPADVPLPSPALGAVEGTLGC